MRYKLLGRSGLRVSEICLGAMTFGEEWGWGAGKEESRRIFDTFVEAGGNFIDTANFYTQGTSERFVGEFIAPDRDRFVLATKYTLNMRPDDPNAGGNHRKNMVQSLHASLERLGTDYIDLYWVHIWDPLTPITEVMRGLDDLVRAGKVLHVGISDAPAWVVSRANTLADLRGWTPFVGLQIQYSLIERTAERDLLPMAKALDIGVTPWGVLGMGILTGKYLAHAEKGFAADTRFAVGSWAEEKLTPRNQRIAQELAAVASDLGRPPGQVALAWLRQQQARCVIVPIVGARTSAQLEESLGCLDLDLSGDALERLEAASRIDPGFPHDFLAQDRIQEILYGETLSRIDPHR